jgi:O-antigen/teichoic acid export membrane protein
LKELGKPLVSKFWSNVLKTSGAKAYSIIVGIIVLVITARLLGAEGRGQVAVILTLAGLFSTFCYLSLGQVALHRMANDPEQSRLGILIGSLILLAVILSVIGWFVAIFIYFYIPNSIFKNLPNIALFIGFLMIPFLIWEHYSSSLLMGLNKLRVYNKFQVIGRTITLFCIFIMAIGIGPSITGVLLAILIGQVIVSAGGLKYFFDLLNKMGQSCRAKSSESKALIKGGFELHLNAVGVYLVTSANVLILNYYSGPVEAGYFQMSIQLLGILMIIPHSASMIIYEKIVKLGPNKAWQHNKRILWQIILIMFGAGMVASILAPFGIRLLLGEDFQRVSELFQWMVLCSIGMTFSIVMGPQWIGRGYFKRVAALTVFIGFLNVSLNFWLIPSKGAQGAVNALIVTYMFSVLANSVMAWHCNIRAKLEKNS